MTKDLRIMEEQSESYRENSCEETGMLDETLYLRVIILVTSEFYKQKET